MQRYPSSWLMYVLIVLCAWCLWPGSQGCVCGVKIECRENADCAKKAPATTCATGLCKECFSDSECRAKGQRCDPQTFLCVDPSKVDGGFPDEPPCTQGEARACYDGPQETRKRSPCHQGIQKCQPGGKWGPCVGQVLPQSEVCDKRDNDCDGQIDEEEICATCRKGTTQPCYTGPAGTQGRGACKAGVQICLNGKWGPCQGSINPTPERCDEIDNDCDGRIDELTSCRCSPNSKRSCSTTGNKNCPSGQQTCLATRKWGPCQVVSTPEVCDGKDNDCNGKVDDNPSGAPACSNSKGVCKGSQSRRCIGGKWQPCNTTDYQAHSQDYQPSESNCDGLDNDCDGKIDEGTTGPCVATIAGGRAAGNTDANGLSARFNMPTGMALDLQGAILIADSNNHKLRKLTLTWDVTTFSGRGFPGTNDGSAKTARFNKPRDIAYNPVRRSWVVADAGGHRIRLVSTTGAVTTLASSNVSTPTPGYADGPANTARFSSPSSVAVDSKGNIYIADTGNNAIRMIDMSNQVSTVAGACANGKCTSGYQDGDALTAKFNGPYGLAIDKQGALLIVDTNNHCIRKLDLSTKQVSTFAGLCGSFGFKDGDAGDALFSAPWGIAVDKAGNVYIADKGNFRIRKINISGRQIQVSTIAGTSSPGDIDGPALKARFIGPIGLVFDTQGRLFVSDGGSSYHHIRMITNP